MKQKTQVLTLSVFILITLSAMAAETVSVIVKKTSIREASQFFAKTVAVVEYNDDLTVLATGEDWLKVYKNGKEGWVHLSAVTPFEAVAPSASGEVSSDYSSGEIALAGKGFSGQVEEQYRQENPELNFDDVDEMEKITVPQEKVVAFQEAGKLSVREIAP